MLQSFVRLIIAIIMFVGVFVLFRKIKMNRVKHIITVVSCVLILLLLCIFPFENIFLSFETPEKAFQYAATGEIVETVTSSESVAMLYKRGANTYSPFFAVKAGKGYKLCPFYSTEKIAQAHMDSLTISVYRLKNAEDYYITISGFADEKIDVSDTDASQFNLIYTEMSNNTVVNCISAINYSEDYCLYLNGKQLKFS